VGRFTRIWQIGAGLLTTLLLCAGASAEVPALSVDGGATSVSLSLSSINGLTGPMVAGDWVAGSQTIMLSAAAPAGIAYVAVVVDGRTMVTRNYPCNINQDSACRNLSNVPLTLDTRRLTDGWHHVTVQVTDGDGQTTSSSNYLFGVSNVAPGPVRSLYSNIKSASGWSRMAQIGIGWKRQNADPAPITETFYTVDQAPTSTDGTSLSGDPLHLTFSPTDGIHTVWIWQQDAAGNVGLASAHSIRIKIDRTPPTLGAWQLSNQNRTLRIAVSDAGSGFASIRSVDALEVGRYDPYFNDELPLTASKSGTTIVVSLPASVTRGRWEIQAQTADALGNTGRGGFDIGVAYPAPPLNQTPPTISGQATVGSTLAIDPGTWTNEPGSFGYLWERCDETGSACTPIGGATGPTFVIDSAEAGDTLRVLAVAANVTSGGHALSAPTSVVPASTSPGAQTQGRRVSAPSTPSTTELSSVQQEYISASVHGIGLAGRYWGNRRFHWYNSLLNDPQPHPQATLWDIVPLFEALDEVAIASPTVPHRQAVALFANHAELYWNSHLEPGPGYSPYPGSRLASTKTYFDDNSWWGLGFMDAYQATGNPRYLTDAENAMGFVIAYGWDQAGGGGLWWNTTHPWRSGEALGAATDLAARLYQATGTVLYLETAERYVSWANHNLLKWDGSYAAQIRNEATMPHDAEGALVAAFTTLCQTGATVPASLYLGLAPNRFHVNPSARRPADPTSWCSWAESLAYKTAFGVPIGTKVFDHFVPLNEGPQWDAIYVRGLLTLYNWDHNPRWYGAAAASAKRILRNAVDGSGRFLRAWNGSERIADTTPGMLRTHAASVSVLAALAASSPPTG
jgi:hypothetical protein